MVQSLALDVVLHLGVMDLVGVSSRFCPSAAVVTAVLPLQAGDTGVVDVDVAALATRLRERHAELSLLAAEVSAASSRCCRAALCVACRGVAIVRCRFHLLFKCCVSG